MNKTRNILTAVAMIAMFVLGTAELAQAQKRNDRDVRDAVRSLNSKLDDFEYNLRYQMQSGSANNGQVSDISDEIRNMRDDLRHFQDNFDRKRENRDDVNSIVDTARRIDQFLSSNPQNRRVSDDWAGVRKQLDRLSSNYGVTNDWQNAGYQTQPTTNDSTNQNNNVSVGLSGTYDIDRQRSESIDDIVADTNLGNDKRQDLKEKLEAPEQIAIDVRGDQVTLATTTSAPIIFTADGRDKVEQSSTGKNVRLRATLTGDKLIVSSLGGETDYTITFTSTNSGQVMKVSRRITTDYLSQTVFAESVYNKTDAVAKLGIPAGGNVGSTNNSGGNGNYPNNNNSGSTGSTDPNGTYSDNDQNGTVTNGGSTNNSNNGSNGKVPTAVRVRPGNYTVPDGTMMTGIIENEINTKVSQNNDRFRMTVQSPTEFRGATIEGYISNINRSGKVTGSSSVTFNFEKIKLQNGQSYDFAGSLKGITDATGKIIKVDNEGTARGDSQTISTAKRGGIGAGIGAAIGAIIGGGSGAAIGAIIGGGAGAGSVAIQDRKDVQITKGSTISLQAAAPNPR